MISLQSEYTRGRCPDANTMQQEVKRIIPLGRTEEIQIPPDIRPVHRNGTEFVRFYV